MDEPAFASEIVELHRFFEGWMSGALDPAGDPVRRLEEALAPGFHRIGPDACCQGRDEVIGWIREAHAASGPDFRIEIRNPVLRFESDDFLLATYEEWQQGGKGPDGRLSSVLFRKDPDGPNGLRWVHVHETPLPG
jgi:hypothetical protein